jgi:multiple sugar transport system ATP-binding protein
MAGISLKDVAKRHGDATVLRGISLDIFDGEFLTLVGPSGCGKSTLLRIIAGLDVQDGGEVAISGRRVDGLRPKDRDVAMVFQAYALYPHLSVFDNIALPLRVRRLASMQRLPLLGRLMPGRRTIESGICRDVEETAAILDIAHLLGRRPAQLSGGQRQRVALGRAMVRRPSVFLMDEPLSNLDAKLRSVMRAQLKHLQRDLATTTIYVTHDQIEAMTLADRIVIMKGGRIQQSGAPAEIYARPANTFVAGFIGSPPMNLITGSVSAGSFVHPAGTFPVKQQADGKVTLGTRPEDIRIASPADGHLTGTIFSSELLGDTVLLGITVGSDLVNVKVGPGGGMKFGEPVGIVLDPARLHAFDAVEGHRLPDVPR